MLSLIEKFLSIKGSRIIISDGTFKYRPSGTYQIYRIFGLVGANETHSTPLVTTLMSGKTRALYDLMWTTIRRELDTVQGDYNFEQANFDFERAAISSFRNVFRGKKITIWFQILKN